MNTLCCDRLEVCGEIKSRTPTRATHWDLWVWRVWTQNFIGSYAFWWQVTVFKELFACWNIVSYVTCAMEAFQFNKCAGQIICLNYSEWAWGMVMCVCLGRVMFTWILDADVHVSAAPFAARSVIVFFHLLADFLILAFLQSFVLFTFFWPPLSLTS